MFIQLIPMESLSHILGKLVFEKKDGFVEIVHRGAPNDRRRVSLREIVRVTDRYFFLESGSKIPLHRIVRIISDDETLWEKK